LIVPLLIFVFWTWWGNWYTYDFGWMVMIMDLGLWMLDMPIELRRLYHVRTATSGWQWYFLVAEWIVLLAMTWRGGKVTYTLFRGRYRRERLDGTEDVRGGYSLVSEGNEPI